MSIVAVSLMGRFGNQCFQYVYSRAYAEKYGHEFQCDSWDGQKIFQLNDKPITAEGLTNRNENDIIEGEGDIVIRSYCQQQKCLIYTASQAREWFKFKPELLKVLESFTWHVPSSGNLAHMRRGDYAGYGYPLVSEESYLKAAENLRLEGLTFIQERGPLKPPYTTRDGFTITTDLFDGDLNMVIDFYLMTQCNVLLRGNSTFSWWAATLNRHGKIYSPVMTGCEGGKESDVPFVEGNYPSFNPMLSFVTDLHLQP